MVSGVRCYVLTITLRSQVRIGPQMFFELSHLLDDLDEHLAACWSLESFRGVWVLGFPVLTITLRSQVRIGPQMFFELSHLLDDLDEHLAACWSFESFRGVWVLVFPVLTISLRSLKPLGTLTHRCSSLSLSPS
ncbi:hypothetical protein V1264_019942 [Littorina saxatilis]|uniref:Uncharacterized protein n=1 Tax=Littorina saxatilis TaxID=31220 RepID=A0AAN9GAU0_9CAEN